MRRITIAFLTFLAAMPSLVCFMPFCPMQSAQAREAIPCHEKYAGSEEGGVMLLSDCMGVDFFAETITNDFQPDQSVDALDFAWAYLNVTYSFKPQNINGIRGPPPEDTVASPSRSLYLTTGRFRI